MERRAPSRRKVRTRRVKLKSPPTPYASTPWPTLEAFLDTEEASIALGSIGVASLGYTAVASDQHNMLVALVRHPKETLHQLLDRLEAALGPALDDPAVYVDEINGEPVPTKSTRY